MLQDTEGIDWQGINSKISPGDRLAIFTSLGFGKPKRVGSDGWARGSLLPDQIKSDKNASVSINLENGSWIDHGSDERGDLIIAVQKCTGRDFISSVKWVADFLRVPYEKVEMPDVKPEWNWFDKNFAEVTVTYTYTDEEGNPLYHVDRIQGKGSYAGNKAFPQRLEGNRKYGGVSKDKMVLYNLPALMRAVDNGDTIYIVEGEKDAETLKDLGYVATTVTAGAGNWAEGYNPYFNGARVVIIPDNDPAGYEHARTVYQNLVDIAAVVDVVLLPGSKHHGDVTDWMEENDADKLAMVFLAGPEPSHWRPVFKKCDDGFLFRRLIALADAGYDEVTKEELAHSAVVGRMVIDELQQRYVSLKVKRS